MARRRRPLTPDTPLTAVPDEILDHFVGQGPILPEELDAAVRRFKKAIIERALGGELTHHLGYPPGGEKPDDTTNHRNGTGGKTVLTEDGPLRIDVPRDREGSFEPRLIGKHERRFTGFDDKILALYARGMTVREIQGFLAEMYGVEVSPDLISTVTDGIVAEVTAGKADRSSGCIRSCSSTPFESRFATNRPFAARRSISRWRSCRMGIARSSGCGSSRPKARCSV
jgi:hypothetical protein